MSAPAAKHGWFVPTPDWLVFGLLASTGVLFASQRLPWFWFNHHKGWTVLAAVAGVCAFFLLALVWLAAALLFRRRFQMRQVRRQQALVDEAEEEEKVASTKFRQDICVQAKFGLDKQRMCW